MRKLAHIEKIENISPIIDKKGKEKRNKCATVLGWQVMVRPDEFKEGDLVIYVEPDSVMPERPEYGFLRKYNYRVKTQQYFKGSFVSQGLVLPLSKLSNYEGRTFSENNIGEDVTKELGITKYISHSEREELSEEAKKNHWTKKYKLTKNLWRYKWFRNTVLPKKPKEIWPYWVAKTDEERIQNIPDVLKRHGDKKVYVTEKIDFQSVTFTGQLVPRYKGTIGKILPKKFKFYVCSRNRIVNDKSLLYWKIAEKYNIEEILRRHPYLTIQGEQGSPKVQGNKYGIEEATMWVFNVIDHKRNYQYNLNELRLFCDKNNLQKVPTIAVSSNKFAHFAVDKLSELGTTVQELVEFSRGKSVLADIPREGVVVRCIENGKKILSFKVINTDFLLKYS